MAIVMTLDQIYEAKRLAENSEISDPEITYGEFEDFVISVFEAGANSEREKIESEKRP